MKEVLKIYLNKSLSKTLSDRLQENPAIAYKIENKRMTVKYQANANKKKINVAILILVKNKI